MLRRPSDMPVTLDFILSYRAIPEPMSGCWLWERSVNTSGYGLIGFGGKVALASRVVASLVWGADAIEGRKVLHKCDQPSCVNPDHLFLGTQAENIADMDKKGRRVSLRGEDHGRAILTAEEALSIRSSLLPRKTLSQKYGVSVSTIDAVKTGRNWRK